MPVDLPIKAASRMMTPEQEPIVFNTSDHEQVSTSSHLPPHIMTTTTEAPTTTATTTTITNSTSITNGTTVTATKAVIKNETVIDGTTKSSIQTETIKPHQSPEQTLPSPPVDYLGFSDSVISKYPWDRSPHYTGRIVCSYFEKSLEEDIENEFGLKNPDLMEEWKTCTDTE